MLQEQFVDKKSGTRFIVFLPKDWNWEYLDDLMFRKGFDPTNLQRTNHISLFDGDVTGKVGDIYVKV